MTPTMTVHFNRELPALGGSIVVKGTPQDIEAAFRRARINEHQYLTLMKRDNQTIYIPFDILGPIEQRR